MKTIIKKFFYFAIIIALFSIPGKSEAQIFTLGFKLTATDSPGYSVSNFPVSVRSIPRHPDDNYLENAPYANNVLSDATLYLDPEITTYLNCYISMLDFVSAGVSFVSQQPALYDHTLNRYEQNQSGTSNLFSGSSLRYYELSRSGLGVGLYASIAPPSIPIIPSKDDVVFGFRPIIEAVYQLVPSNIYASAGWDRYNQREEWKSFPIGTIKQHYVDYGIEFTMGIPVKGLKSGTVSRLSLYIGYAQAFVEPGGPIIYKGDSSKNGIIIGFGTEIVL